MVATWITLSSLCAMRIVPLLHRKAQNMHEALMTSTKTPKNWFYRTYRWFASGRGTLRNFTFGGQGAVPAVRCRAMRLLVESCKQREITENLYHRTRRRDMKKKLSKWLDWKSALIRTGRWDVDRLCDKFGLALSPIHLSDTVTWWIHRRRTQSV